jgi:hypothetical protein
MVDKEGLEEQLSWMVLETDVEEAERRIFIGDRRV